MDFIRELYAPENESAQKQGWWIGLSLPVWIKREKLRKSLCVQNANGNTLDKLVCNEIIKLSADDSALLKNIEAIKIEVANNNDEYEEKLASLRKNFDENKKKIGNLVKTISDNPASEYIKKEISELHKQNEVLQTTITDYEELTQSKFLSDEQITIIKSV